MFRSAASSRGVGGRAGSATSGCAGLGVSEATRQNNPSAVKVNEAAQRLKEIAGQLQRTVAHFSTGVVAGGNVHG